MLEALLRIFNISVVNTIILLSITAIFIVGLVFTHKNIHKNFVNYIPSLLTTIGIFGTFLGIVLGLLSFDQNNIEASIPPLLEGLKTAFITSLAGMFASIIFKTLSTFSFLSPKEEEDERYAVTPLDYLMAIQMQTEEIQTMRKALVAPNEPSLSYQLNSLRMDINANAQLSVKRAETEAKLMQHQLENISYILSDLGSKDALDALKEAIAEYNINLTEQFGNKFKYFNEGLTKALEWQQSYQDQLEQMQTLCVQTSESLIACESAIASIAKDTQEIPKTMQSFNEVMAVSQEQLQQLEGHLEAFKEMREKAVDAVPQLNKHLQSTLDSLCATVTYVTDQHQGLLTESNKVIQAHIEASNEFIEQFSQETNASIEYIKKTNISLVDDVEQAKSSIIQSSELLETRLKEVIEQAAETQIQQAERTFAAMEDQIAQQAGFTAEAVGTQLKLIDQAMQHEIQRVTSEMGQALTQISGQFVEDYSKLTTAMKKIIINQQKMNQQAE